MNRRVGARGGGGGGKDGGGGRAENFLKKGVDRVGGRRVWCAANCGTSVNGP